MVPDGANGTDDVLVYLNGTLANTTLTGTVRTLNTTPTLSARTSTWGMMRELAPLTFSTARLDDVQIYDTALTPAEVLSLYNDPGSVIGQPPVAAPMAHWKLDDGSGSTAADTAGSNVGTLVGSPLPAWTSGVDGGALEFDGVSGQEVTATVAGLPTGNAPADHLTVALGRCECLRPEVFLLRFELERRVLWLDA